MTEKIEWYKEVLELEPNSKVFFPLARLLAEDGQLQEAITTLEEGLLRHHEFLEARLFLIELLHKTGQKDSCGVQVEKLNGMFANYAGFWQAWAACLATEKGEADTASVLRFLAAHFVSGPIQLHEVLNRGLDSILKEHRGADTGSCLPEDPSVQAGGSSASDAVPGAEQAEEPVSGNAADTIADSAPSAQQIEEENFEDVAEQPATPIQTIDEAGGESGALEAEHAAEEIPEAVAMPAANETARRDSFVENGVKPAAGNGLQAVESPAEEESGQPLKMVDNNVMENQPADPQANDSGESQDVEPVELAETKESAGSKADTPINAEAEAAGDLGLVEMSEVQAVAPVVESSPQNENNTDEEFVPAQDLNLSASAPCAAAGNFQPGISQDDEDALEESFSLRTRSMAEVLAEQGDVRGALDIYHELSASAAGADELADINRRIVTLEGMMGLPQEPENFVVEKSNAAASSKEKLMGMLEALALRVEARAQG